MIYLKTDKEVEKIYQSCQITKAVMEKALAFCVPGVSTMQIDSLIRKEIEQRGAKPAFLGFEGYKFSSCLSLNDEVVHGLPGKRLLKIGDIIKVDMGSILDGWYSDMARTKIIGFEKLSEDKKNGLTTFLEAGKRALRKATLQAWPDNYVGDISSVMQKEIEKEGFAVIRDLVGHGVGKNLHEDPNVECYGKPRSGYKLKVGMVLAIEVMYVMGNYKVFIEKDNWTFKTLDKSIAGMYEDTVAITKNGPRVLTM